MVFTLIIMVIILLVLTPVGIVVDKKIEAYFENAKREYYKDINAKQKEKQDKVVNKYKQAKKMPRADKLSGGGDTSGKSDVDIAIEMMNNRPWEKIPEKYQKILLGE